MSADGAAFALLPVPDPGWLDEDDVVLADVELLSPDRLVRYLARPFDLDVLEALAETWRRCAAELLPEQSVPALEHAPAGLSVRVVGSSDLAVVLECLVVPELDDEPADVDGLNFEVRRATLVRAAIELREWVDARRAEGVQAR